MEYEGRESGIGAGFCGLKVAHIVDNFESQGEKQGISECDNKKARSDGMTMTSFNNISDSNKTRQNFTAAWILSLLCMIKFMNESPLISISKKGMKLKMKWKFFNSLVLLVAENKNVPRPPSSSKFVRQQRILQYNGTV